MKEFRFIGSETTYGQLRLEKLGQRFTAPPEDVYGRGGVPALETSEFESLIPPSVVAELEFPGMRTAGPPELLQAEGLAPARAEAMAALRSAWAALATRRAEFQGVTNG